MKRLLLFICCSVIGMNASISLANEQEAQKHAEESLRWKFKRECVQDCLNKTKGRNGELCIKHCEEELASKESELEG